jgi:hypothetical protein
VLSCADERLGIKIADKAVAVEATAMAGSAKATLLEVGLQLQRKISRQSFDNFFSLSSKKSSNDAAGLS